MSTHPSLNEAATVTTTTLTDEPCFVKNENDNYYCCDNCDYDEIVQTLGIMYQQETDSYLKKDFFKLHQQRFIHESSISNSRMNRNHCTDILCRTQMIQWCYQLVSYLEFQHETVEVAVNILDRYMMTTPLGYAAYLDRKVYQLVSMTSLYTAIKIHESSAVELDVMTQLSRNTVSAQQMSDMEYTILSTIEWKVHPPTSMSFVRQYIRLLSPILSNSTSMNRGMEVLLKDEIYNISIKQCEYALREYSSFITVKASTIAYCSLLNSIDGLVHDDHVSRKMKHRLEKTVSTILHVDLLKINYEMRITKNRLRKAFFRRIMEQDQLLNNINVISSYIDNDNNDIPSSNSNISVSDSTIDTNDKENINNFIQNSNNNEIDDHHHPETDAEDDGTIENKDDNQSIRSKQQRFLLLLRQESSLHESPRATAESNTAD